MWMLLTVSTGANTGAMSFPHTSALIHICLHQYYPYSCTEPIPYSLKHPNMKHDELYMAQVNVFCARKQQLLSLISSNVLMGWSGGFDPASFWESYDMASVMWVLFTSSKGQIARFASLHGAKVTPIFPYFSFLIMIFCGIYIILFLNLVFQCIDCASLVRSQCVCDHRG